MHFIGSPTELTTSVTDALLTIECLVIILWLLGSPAAERWRMRLWCWAYGLLGFASLLGALAHGLEMSDAVRAALWRPLYLSLGVLMALFVVGAIADWRGWGATRGLVPWGIGLGAVFFGVTQLWSGAFIIFIVYEAAAMVGALAIYVFLAATRRLKGAAMIALAILLNLVAAAVQASSVRLQVFFTFDHNGVFHLVEMLSLAALGLGLRLGSQSRLRTVMRVSPHASSPMEV